MIDLKPIKIKPISQDLDNAFKKNSGANPYINLEKLLSKNFKENKILLESRMEDFLLIFDEGIKSIIQVHELCLQNQIKNKQGFTFVALTSKLVTLLIGIRKLLYSGLADCTKTLNRSFIESIDMIFACLINQDLNESYSNMNELYDSNDFYWKNLAKGKLQKEYVKLFRKIRITEDYIKFIEEKRKEQRAFFSESIHASFKSSIANFVMSTIDFDIKYNCFGKVTTAYPMLLMRLIEDIYLFNKIFFIAIEKEICPDFNNIEIDSLTNHYYSEQYYSNAGHY